MQRKWITWLKTLGLVLLVAFGINLLFVGAIVLADYNRLFGTSVWRTVLLGVAFVIVRLWQQRDHAAPPLWEPQRRWQWLEGKPDRKLAMLLLVALIAVSGFAIYLAQHQQQREAMTPPRWDDLSPTPPAHELGDEHAGGLSDEQMDQAQVPLAANPYVQFLDAPARQRLANKYCAKGINPRTVGLAFICGASATSPVLIMAR